MIKGWSEYVRAEKGREKHWLGMERISSLKEWAVYYLDQ